MLTVGLIGLGFSFILFSLIPAIRLLFGLRDQTFRMEWYAVVILISFFMIGYIAVLGLLYSGNTPTFQGLTGAIFLGGGIFVWFSVRVAVRAITSLLKYQGELELKLTDQQLKAIHSAKLAALGETAAGIAHEINNPLAVIQARAQLLLYAFESGKEASTEEVINSLKSIETAVERTSKTIKSLRRLSHSPDGETKGRVKFSAVVEDVHELWQFKFKDQGISLKIRNERDDILFCRQAQVGQVLLNLIKNSFDAVAGTSSPWIEIDCASGENMISISVTDSGHGISEKISEKVFQPFFTTKPVGAGAGLGLSIAARIASDHGGHLYLDSSSPNTRFIFELPVE